MKYQICVTDETRQEIDSVMREHPDIPIIYKGCGEVMMTAVSMDEDIEKCSILLMEGSIVSFVKACIKAFQSHVDSIRFGWPRNLVMPEG